MKRTKTILFAIAMMMTCMHVWAQKPKDHPDYRYFYRDGVIETDDALITIVDVVSKAEYIKMKVRIQNKTNDYLLYKSWETGIKYADKTYHPANKGSLLSSPQIVIGPYETDSKVIDIKSEGKDMKTEEFELQMTGLYRISANGNVIAAPNFALPPKVNEFKAATVYSCTMTKLVKETKITEVTFQCKYTGTGVGLLQPVKAAAKLESGQEYANSNLKARTYLLTPGEEEKMKVEFSIPGKVADMQFANMEILWKETFRDGKAIPVPEKSVKISMDAGLTEGKNK